MKARIEARLARQVRLGRSPYPRLTPQAKRLSKAHRSRTISSSKSSDGDGR